MGGLRDGFMGGIVYVDSLRLGGHKFPTYELILRLLGVTTMYGGVFVSYKWRIYIYKRLNVYDYVNLWSQLYENWNRENISEIYFWSWNFYAVIVKQNLQ